jgi:elongation factor G
MLEEEPSARVERSDTGEQVQRAIGEAHVAVITERLKRKFGAAIVTRTPTVPYRETIRGKTQVHGRYKKQTGGHGMFGDVWLELEPNPGAGVEFAERIVGGSVPRGFFAGIEKGIRETAAEGVFAGYPLIDFRATLYDGSYHAVDSNELSFKMAGRLAFKDAMSRARPTLLEPIMNVEVYAPSEFAGDLMGDLNSRRGRIAGMDARATMTVIRAQVPMSEMLTYEQQLTSATGGRGSYQMEYSHYEEVPNHLQAKVIAAAKAERGEEAEEEE